MKSYSARKLLNMAVNGQHAPYCQRTAFPVADCLCFKHEVKTYQDKLAASAKTRVRKAPKARPHKIHLDSLACSRKPNANKTNDINNVTCQHCIKTAKRQGIGASPPAPIPSNGVNYASFTTNP